MAKETECKHERDDLLPQGYFRFDENIAWLVVMCVGCDAIFTLKSNWVNGDDD